MNTVTTSKLSIVLTLETEGQQKEKCDSTIPAELC